MWYPVSSLGPSGAEHSPLPGTLGTLLPACAPFSSLAWPIAGEGPPAPSPPAAQPLLCSLGNPALIGCTYPWRRTPAEQTQAEEGLRAEGRMVPPSPPLPPRCHEGSVPGSEPSLLARAHPEGGRGLGRLEHPLCPQVPNGAAHAQEAGPAGPFQLSLACHQLP